MTWEMILFVMLIVVIVLVDLWHGWARRESLVTAKLVVLVGLAMFIAFPDIQKLSWSGKELSLERQATAVSDVMASVAALGISPTESQVTRLFDRAAGVETEAWVRLVTTRMALRSLLRSACTKVEECKKKYGTPGPHKSQRQIECLQKHQKIDYLRFLEIDRLRQATESAEWGGDPPPVEELEFVLREGPRILKELAQVGSEWRGYSPPTSGSLTPIAATPTPTAPSPTSSRKS